MHRVAGKMTDVLRNDSRKEITFAGRGASNLLSVTMEVK